VVGGFDGVPGIVGAVEGDEDTVGAAGGLGPGTVGGDHGGRGGVVDDVVVAAAGA
jgi:hypothetical protein